IGGPIFLSDVPDLKKPLLIHGGNVAHLCPPSSAPANLVVDAPFTFLTGCATQVPVPDHVLPAALASAPDSSAQNANGSPASGDAQCRIFHPGLYRSPPNVNANDRNYFESGVYYFKNIGAWNVKQTIIVAGAPKTATEAVLKPAPCETDSSTTNGFGATFIFGGDSFINFDTKSHF